MSETENPGTAIEKQVQSRLLDVLSRYKKTIDAILPQMIDPKRFAYLAVSAVRANPALANVSPASFINCVMLATQMGLEIRRDSAYLIPFGNVCQLLIDYKGKLTLARRSGKVGGIQAVTVRQRDAFTWGYGRDGLKFNHEPFANGILSPDERGPIVGVYAFAELTGGGMQFREPMSIDEIERIRKRSRAGVSSMSFQQIMEAHEVTDNGQQVWQGWGFNDKRRQPWVTDYEAMALKTVLHSLCKSLPLDPGAQLSQEVDAGIDTGQQPNILADAVNIDPVDEKPMIETTDAEGVQQVAKKKIVDLGGNPDEADLKRPPLKGTLSAINGFKTSIGIERWSKMMGAAGYETTAQIRNEAEAREIKHNMQEVEADLSAAD